MNPSLPPWDDEARKASIGMYSALLTTTDPLQMETDMKTNTKLFIAAMAAVAFALPLASMAGPDANQQAMIQKVQQAKKELAAAQAAAGAERQKKMETHM